MPRWFGMAIHYATFKRVLTSRDGWVFSWGGEGKTDKMLMLSPPRPCSCCRATKRSEAERVRRQKLADNREFTRTYAAESRVVVDNNAIKVVAGSEPEVEVEV